MLGAVPTLDEIARDPLRALALGPEQAVALLAQCGAAQAALMAGLARPMPQKETASDETLNVDQIAREMGVPRRWVFRNVAKLPFVRRVSRKALVCSRADLARWRSSRKA
jgi:hypothetical protein